MNKISTGTFKKSIRVFSIVATLLIATMGITATSMNAYASIFEDIRNVDDVGQSLECVIVVVGCDGTGSVDSSGDVIIGSGNGNDDNNTNGGGGDEPGTLTVFKEVECQSTNQAICDYAETSANFPDPEDYPITVTGNNPEPGSFPGSDTGTPVTIGAGDYTVDETLASTGAIQSELNADSIITTTTAEGDCTPNLGPNQNFLDATGTMTSGGSEECTLINTVVITGGTIPTG